MTKPRRKMPPLPPGGYDPTGTLALPGASDPSERHRFRLYTAPLTGDLLTDAGQSSDYHSGTWIDLGYATGGDMMLGTDSTISWTTTLQALRERRRTRPVFDSLGYAVLFPRDPFADLARERLLSPDYTGDPAEAAEEIGHHAADFHGADGVIAECRRELRRYTYRPGVELRVDPATADDHTPPRTIYGTWSSWNHVHFGTHDDGNVECVLKVTARSADGAKVQRRRSVLLNLGASPEQRREMFGMDLLHLLYNLESELVRRMLTVDGVPLARNDDEEGGW